MARKPRGTNVEVKKRGKAAPKAETNVPTTSGTAHPMLNLRQEMDRVFNDFEKSFPSLSFPFGFGRSAFDMEPFRRFGHTFEADLPSVDMSESADAFTLSAEMPGLEEKDVDVTLSDDLLTVQGEKKEERSEEEDDYHISERRFGSFKRSFRLPASVEADKISASITNGVLTVTLPKTKEAKEAVKKIDVKGS